MGWQAQCECNLATQGYDLYVVNVRDDGVRECLCDMKFVEVAEYGVAAKVQVRDQQFLQAIVDAAWRAGIRPEALQADASEIGATKRHLEDMRALVFKSGKPKNG